MTSISNQTLTNRRHTGDTGVDAEHEYEYEPRHRYSLSDMITHIKRSIPDLRSINNKHQLLENKESPSGSPKCSQNKACDAERMHHQQSFGGMTGGACNMAGHHKDMPRLPLPLDKDTDAVTLSAITETSCTCGGRKGGMNIAIDKPIISDDLDALPIPHSTSHHHCEQIPEAR